MSSESEQAQAIAEIKAAHKGALDIIAWDADCEKAVNVRTVLTMMGKLLEIVDSQAQKIAELKDNIEAWKAGSKSQSHIMADQAQKNEKLLAENNVLAILVDELKADREAQAQRIAAKDSRITALQTLYSEANQEAQKNYVLTVEQAQKVDTQAKEIDKLKDRLRFEMLSEAKEGI